MIRTIFSLLLGFFGGVVFSYYFELDIDQYLDFDINQYLNLKSKKSVGFLSIEHNFQYEKRYRKFDKVLLQITKYNGPDVQISSYNIPLANHEYHLDVEINELKKENDFNWVIYEGGVIHRIPGNPSFISSDSLAIFDKGTLNEVRVISQEAKLTGITKAVHSIVIHNYNLYAVKPKLLLTYFSKNGNAIWDTVIVAKSEIPPKDNNSIRFQIKSKKIPRAETSNISIVEVDHLRP